MTNNERLPALREAIDLMGGILATRAALGVTHQAVYAWFRRGAVPTKHALMLEAMTGVPRDRLLSDADRALLAQLARNDVL